MNESKSLISLARRFNNVNLIELQSTGYLPFKFGETRIGTISPLVLEEMKPHPSIFSITPECVRLNQDLKCYDERSDELRKFMEKMREKNLFTALVGWRDECYETRLKFGDPPIFKVSKFIYVKFRGLYFLASFPQFILLFFLQFQFFYVLFDGMEKG